jgi:L-alanine-DL-glutamate epimerase-like enolase superfamily enzyme
VTRTPRVSSASGDEDAAGIQLVDVSTDAGVTGTGFVSVASGSSTSCPTIRLLEFQARLFAGPLLREERRDDGIFLVPPDTPGLGLALDPEFAAASLVSE